MGVDWNNEREILEEFASQKVSNYSIMVGGAIFDSCVRAKGPGRIMRL